MLRSLASQGPKQHRQRKTWDPISVWIVLQGNSVATYLQPCYTCRPDMRSSTDSLSMSLVANACLREKISKLQGARGIQIHSVGYP